MNKNKFKRMLVLLAQNYNHDLEKERIEVLSELAEGTFGFGYDWQKITHAIALKEVFFPNLATINTYVKKEQERRLWADLALETQRKKRELRGEV